MSALGAALSVIGSAAAVGTGLVFLGAGAGKWRHRVLLPGVVANYRLLPARWVAPVAAVLPVAELALGLGLLVSPVPGWPLATAVAAGAMALLLLFAVAMAVNIRRGRAHIDCGCGRSHLRQPLSWVLVARNLVLALLLAPCLAAAPLAGAMDVVTALAGGVALWLAYLMLNALAALAASPLVVSRR